MIDAADLYYFHRDFPEETAMPETVREKRTRRTAREIAQDTLDKATERVEKAKKRVDRLKKELDGANREVTAAERARDYAVQHPDLQPDGEVASAEPEPAEPDVMVGPDGEPVQ